jgi:glycosyltransferase involved in cell wall biosynthesis
VKSGYDIKLVVLSDGPEKEKLFEYIQQNELQNSIFMVGYRRDIMNFIAATDVVVHVSESEASSNLAKEVGLLNKPLVVCSDVGDFDEYLVNGVNSLIVDKNNVTEEIEKLIIAIYNDRKMVEGLGQKLHNTVFERFSIDNIINQYNQFHTKN